MSIINLLQSLKTEQQLQIKTKTAVKLLKKDKEGNKNLLPNIYKIATSVVVVNKSYEKAVNEIRQQEEKSVDFVAEGRVWGEAKGALIENNGAVYLNAILVDTIGSEYFTENGDPISINEFQQFFSTAKSVSRQGTDEEVKVRNYKIESILDVQLI